MDDGQGLAAACRHRRRREEDHSLSDPFWEKVRDVFHDVSSAPPEERAAKLAAACAGDAALREEVESLLASHDEAAEFLEPDREPDRPSFAAGDLVSGRYRIARLLGTGGMGEVYEAEDGELRESVALKIIRPEIASNPRILARFRREIQLARRVTHPNVCRIYDVSSHRTDPGSRAERKISFVSMELLHGPTLAAKLRGGGRMAPAEALPIVRQMASGLDAAHAASIVHRDFKSANVMLATASASSADVSELRAVITDFGLAHDTGSESADRDARLTDTGMVVGTPDYMAPEQLEEGPLTPATDVYALGVVMFEMVTGRLPFDGNTPMAIAMSRLRNPAPSPRRLVPGLDERWEAVILRCLERDPAQRYQRAGEVAAALEEGTPLPRRPRTATPERSRRTAAILIAASAVAIALPFVLQHRGAAPAVPPPTPAAQPAVAFKPRRTVAVLGFRNLSARGDQAWLSEAVSELLSSEVSAAETFRLIPRDDVARLESDFALRGGEVARAALPRIHERLGTDVVVSGTYLSAGTDADKALRLDVRLQDAASGEVVGTISETGTQADLLGLVSRVGSRLREGLGAAPLSAEAKAALRASYPVNPEAARLYAEGLTNLRRYDSLSARSLFEQAIVKEPGYPMSHSALAEAFWNLGFEDRAAAEADRALSLASQLGREERLTIEARAAVFHKQWDKAIEIYRSLLTFYPDELPYGLRLGAVQNAAGKATDAIATMEKLRALPPPLRNDPGIDLIAADAYQSLHDSKRELDVARRAETAGAALGMRTVVARAKASQSFALLNLNQLEASTVILREAARLYEAAGDRAGMARCYSNLGFALWNRGDLNEAEALLQKALAIHRQVGSRSFESRTLNNVGMVRFAKGDTDGAEQVFDQALAVERESNFVTMIGPTLSNLGGVRQLRGDLAGAQKLYAEAIEMARRTDDRTGEMTAMVNSAETLRLSGHLADSRTQYDRSAVLAHELKLAAYESYVLAGLGELALVRGDLAEARRQHTAALDMRQKASEYLTAAESAMMLANLAIEETAAKAGNAEDAGNAGNATSAERKTGDQIEAPLRQAIAVFAKQGAAEDEAAAHETLARALLLRGDAKGATQEMVAARKVAKATRTVTLLAALSATEARVLIAERRAGDAAAKALESATIARRGQFLAGELDALLVSAAAEDARGKPAEARAVRERVRQRAERSGMLLYARKAADKS
jgi:serine/threonine protein kinase/tetratricopeptide (TPR) repeat protein